MKIRNKNAGGGQDPQAHTAGLDRTTTGFHHQARLMEIDCHEFYKSTSR